MIDLRKRILLIILAVVGGLAALVIFFLALRRSAPENAPLADEPPSVPVTVGEDTRIINDGPINRQAAPAEPLDERRFVRQLAGMFAERFGSYSNQNNNAHLLDLEFFSTSRMNRWLDSQRQTYGAVYAGQTTRVVASSVTAFDEERATVAIDVQQENNTSTTTGTIYRHGRVELVKEGNEWKVDGLFLE